MTDETMNAQQLAAMQKMVAGEIARLRKDLELRKFCLEKAIEACSGTGEIIPLQFAQEFYGFVTRGLDDAN